MDQLTLEIEAKEKAFLAALKERTAVGEDAGYLKPKEELT